MKQTEKETYLNQLDPRVKIVAFFTIAAISTTTPAKAYQAFAGYFLILLLISITSRLNSLKLIKRVAIAMPFILLLVIFLPFFGASGEKAACSLFGFPVYQEGLIKLFAGTTRAILAIFSVSILAASTPFDQLIEGFGALGMPKVFLAIASFMQRYTHVLVDEAQRMKRARDSRNFSPKWIWQAKTIGNMIATLFLRSYERGERVYISMLSRGYDGRESPARGRQALTLSDLTAGLALMLPVAMIRLLTIS